MEEQNRSVAIEDAVEAEAAGPGPDPVAVPPGAKLEDVIQHCSFTSFPSPLLVLVLTPLILDEGGEDEDEERGSRKEGRK